MKLYADPITVNCRKVVAGLDLIGAEYELVHVDYFTSQQRSPEYIALNPNASLPTLVDGEFVLWESNAILQYVADKLGATTCYPTDLRTRADINRWLLWEAAHWFPSCYVYLVEHCVKPLTAGGARPRRGGSSGRDLPQACRHPRRAVGQEPLDRRPEPNHR